MGQLWDFRYLPGVLPVYSRKILIKWLSLEKHRAALIYERG